jgi:hypothetical protein
MGVQIKKTPQLTVGPDGYRGWDIECEWGTFDNADCHPNRPTSHLILITPDYVQALLESGPILYRGGVSSASEDSGRLFAHFERDGQRWTWELFEADWWDGGGPEILIGRWPD